jgi:hypothetical protein
MEDMKWSYSGVLGVLAANNLVFGYRLWLKSAAKFLASNAAPRGHDMSKISHTQPSYHRNIPQWTHMEEMKWSAAVVCLVYMLDVLAANNLGFGYRLWLKSANLLANDNTKRA